MPSDPSSPTESALTRPAARPATVSMLTLSTFVIGSMVGAGVFSLPAGFAAETGVAGTLIAWAVAGGGMLALAFAFQLLANRRPDLDAGVYSYARAGFGRYLGYFSAFGYWASACAGNVFYWVFITSTLGAVFPALGAGDTVAAVAVSSAGLWLFFILIRRGVRSAAAVNRVVSIAKTLPIVVFVILCATVFDPAVFAANWAGPSGAPLWDQIRATMLVTVFVFIGLEGASVNSRHARSRRDVGRATLLGFLSVLAVFASVTIVSFGVLPREEIAALPEPSLGGVLETIVGPAGAVFIGASLIVAVLGAYLSWTLMAAEVLLEASRSGDLPRFLSRTNADDTPVGALLLSTTLVQVLLVVVLFAENAFSVALDLTSVLVLIPFVLSAGYALKLTITGETYRPGDRARMRDLVVAVIATAYTTFLLIAAGAHYLLLSLLIIVPGTALFAAARRRAGARVFTRIEWLIFGASVIGAACAVVLLATGRITL
ncbi:basic amino acid/polyamine antiporter [Microbacterium sp. H37-C3]|uniref:basic amino acid/polyamine antiporter n=1 Tax=Microbacterium sp. H37-C3 TaxID=3004354 RepID=UPI0022AFBE6A|nr:basic amino acid/polyamine antiporter [Microbacterium sp. H37-C3]MCZ4066135.1 basic amino acid/polyamine antiporter [Microbacterium sp. H37-C3]